jgi:hypothetical protein
MSARRSPLSRGHLIVLALCLAALPSIAMAAELQPTPAGEGFGGAIDVQPGSIDGQVVLEPGSVALRARLVDPGIEGQLQVTLPGMFIGSANASDGVLTYAIAVCGAGVTFGIEGTRNSDVRLTFRDAASGSQACAAPPPAAAADSLVMGALEPASAQAQATDGDGVTVLANWGRRFFGFALIGLLLVALIPALPRALDTATRTAPWARIGTGVALALTMPLIGLLVFAIGLGIGLWWLGVLVLALYPVLLVLSMIVSGLALGSVLNRALNRPSVPIMLAFAVGLAILTLASVLPYVGPVVSIVAIIFGLGVLVLAPRSSAPATSEPPASQPTPAPEPEAPLPSAPLAAA